MGGQKECESFLLCVHYFYLLLTHLKKMKIGRGQITSYIYVFLMLTTFYILITTESDLVTV